MCQNGYPEEIPKFWNFIKNPAIDLRGFLWGPLGSPRSPKWSPRPPKWSPRSPKWLPEDSKMTSHGCYNERNEPYHRISPHHNIITPHTRHTTWPQGNHHIQLQARWRGCPQGCWIIIPAEVPWKNVRNQSNIGLIPTWYQSGTRSVTGSGTSSFVSRIVGALALKRNMSALWACKPEHNKKYDIVMSCEFQCDTWTKHRKVLLEQKTINCNHFRVSRWLLKLCLPCGQLTPAHTTMSMFHASQSSQMQTQLDSSGRGQ